MDISEGLSQLHAQGDYAVMSFTGFDSLGFEAELYASFEL